jgi:phosphate transport system substrate-binding protein
MRRQPLSILLALGLAASSCNLAPTTVPEGATVLRGAGATFPNPLYKKWTQEYHARHPDVVVDFQAVGSGKGVERFLAEAVDFAASDRAMTDAEMAQVNRGVLLVPATAGAIAIVYNVPGISTPLRLKRDVYVDIFLGTIKRWNDPRIQESNPDVELPRLDIARVARQDDSGTTFAFTNHLAAISEGWKNGPGVGGKIAWPGATMLVQGNPGVAAQVQRSIGAIGYVEYGYAHRLGLAVAALENKAGAFVTPSAPNGLATLTNARLPADFRAFFPDPDGKDAYSIVTYTWLLLYRRYPDTTRGAALKRFLTWCLEEGQQYSEGMGYIRLPSSVVADAVKAVEAIQLGP